MLSACCNPSHRDARAESYSKNRCKLCPLISNYFLFLAEMFLPYVGVFTSTNNALQNKQVIVCYNFRVADCTLQDESYNPVCLYCAVQGISNPLTQDASAGKLAT